MQHILLTLSACLAFAAGYAEKPVKGAHLRLENATYNFGDVPRKGGDLVREISDMPLDVFDPAAYDASGGLVFRRIGGLIYMPELTTDTLGAFVQVQHRFNDLLSLEGGVRYDRAEASFDTFTPLSQSRAPSPVAVQGGTISYDAWTFNVGAVLTPMEGHEFYASFSQGFQLPDIGLQLRNAGAGFNINNSDLQPVTIDSYEAGWRGEFGAVNGAIALFHTTSLAERTLAAVLAEAKA